MSKLIKHVREAPKNVCFPSAFFVYFLVSVNPLLSNIHYIKQGPYYSLQHFFVIYLLVP